MPESRAGRCEVCRVDPCYCNTIVEGPMAGFNPDHDDLDSFLLEHLNDGAFYIAYLDALCRGRIRVDVYDVLRRRLDEETAGALTDELIEAMSRALAPKGDTNATR